MDMKAFDLNSFFQKLFENDNAKIVIAGIMLLIFFGTFFSMMKRKENIFSALMWSLFNAMTLSVLGWLMFNRVSDDADERIKSRQNRTPGKLTDDF